MKGWRLFISSFTHKERIGVVVLCVGILVGVLIYVYVLSSDRATSMLAVTDITIQPNAKQSTAKSNEINTMDNSDFQEQCNLTEKSAEQVIAYRIALGGFYTIKQLEEVLPIADSTLSRWMQLLSCNPHHIKKIPVRIENILYLQKHPYIGKGLAELLLRIKQHQKNISKEKLEQLVSKDRLNKIDNYLIFD